MSNITLRFQSVDDGLSAGFRKANQQLDSFKAGADRVANSISGVFRAVAPIAAAAAIAGLAHEALQFADAAKKMQEQTGFSNDTVQRLSFIAGQASVEVGTLTSGTLKLQKVLGGFEEGSDKSTAALQRLGLATTNFRNLAPEQQFTEVAKAIAGISDQNLKVVATTDLFGKSGGELLPVLNAIGNEAGKLEEKFDSIGGAVGKNTIDIVDDLGDELQTTALAAKSFATELLGLVSPPLIAGLKGLQVIISGLRIAAGGGGNEIVNADNKVLALEREMTAELAANWGSSAGAEALRDAIRKRFAPAIAEARAAFNRLAGLGNEGANFPVPAIDLTAPSLRPDQFEETDAVRAQRLKDEEEARVQRLQFIAANQLIERDMEFQHQQVLSGITQERLDRDIQATAAHERQRVRILSDGEEFLANVRRTFGIQQIKLEEIKSQSILQIAGQMFGQLAAQNSKLAKIQQGIALAQTIWSTATGIMKAFETLPWPANLAAAAKVAIVGAIQIAKIKSTNYNPGSVSGTAPTLAAGGAGVSSNGSSSTDGNLSAVTEARGATNIYLSGIIDKSVIDYVIEGLREGFDRDVVLIPVNSAQASAIRGYG